MQKILDDYFFKVCYEFYKRQMHIWILLRHKYFRTASINIENRRFLYNDMGANEEDAQSSPEAKSPEVPEEDGSLASKAEGKYPVWFSESESEPILEMTLAIKAKLEFLVRGTTEGPAVGNLA